MKLMKKAGIVISIMALMTMAFSVNASAATVSDGIKTEITFDSQGEDKLYVDAAVKNANYYEIDGINCKLSISDNAELSGETVKTDIYLASEQSENLQAEINLKDTEPTNTTNNPIATSAQNPTNKPETPTQAATQPKGATTIKDTSTIDNSSIKTGQQDFALIIALLILLAFSGAMVWAFKKKNKRILSIMLCMCLTMSVGAVGISSAHAATNDKMSVITDQADFTINGVNVTVTFTVEYPEQLEIHDNSIDDLKALNGGSLDITYNEMDEISFLNGKYTDYKVINEETAMSSLQAVETILNVKDNDISLISADTKTDNNGDKYYTFKQNVGSVVLYDSYFTVGADKDGNTLCISSSIQPNAGYEELEGKLITSEQAMALAEKIFGSVAKKADKEPVLDFVSNTTAGTSNLCWIVFFESTSESEQDKEKSRFIKVYIDAGTGKFVDLIYTSEISDGETDDSTYNNDIYFNNVTTEMMTFKDFQGKTVELPVAKGDNGKYYFLDTDKKMLCVNSVETEKTNFTVPVPYEFSTSEEVSAVFVSVFENMRKIYDNYLANGVKSIDGKGLPLMVGLGYQEYGEEIENACYSGKKYGWGTFMFSDFPISTGLDVAAHEFTHGIKANTTGTAAYQNVSGAIEESYADILGNLTEMIIDPENSDTETWKLAEGTGNPIRSMSNPHSYMQPEYIGDKYYLMKCDPVSSINDYGGVHVNNSILSKICYEMYKSGISMQENYELWLDTFYVFNPNASYDDVLAYVKYIAKRNGKTEYINLIQQLFEKANAVDANTENWDEYSVPENCAKLTITAHDFPEGLDWSGLLYIGNSKTIVYKDSTKTYRTFIDKDNFKMVIRYQKDENSASEDYYYKPLNDDGYNLTIDKDEVVVDFSYNDLVPRD